MRGLPPFDHRAVLPDTHIITVTLNPAIDMTVRLASPLTRGVINSALESDRHPGGKGINVASTLADWGIHSFVTGLLGRDNADTFVTFFRRRSLADGFIRLPGRTRTNVKIVDDEETTDINFPGLEVTEEDLRLLLRPLLAAASAGPCIVSLSGSLPRRCPADIYVDLTRQLRELGARVMLDASGDALREALAAPLLPHFIKPNRDELAGWAGRPLEGEADILRAVRPLLERGLELAAVSMGPEGALFITPGRTLHAVRRLRHLASTVGAGDAMVAGIIAAMTENGDLERIARLSTAFAAAHVDADFAPGLRGRQAIEELAAGLEVREV